MECGKIEDVCTCKSAILQIEHIYIVDLKGATGAGGIEAYDEEQEYESLLLRNLDHIPVRLVAFEENAFKVRRCYYAKQCECVVYPEPSLENSWLLFVEMKYAKNENNIECEGWHKKAVEQIRSTVGFLKQNGTISSDKKLNAIVSFPKLSAFSSWLTQYIQNELEPDNIIARCTNAATIIDDQILILA